MKNRFTGVVIGQLIGLLIVCIASTFIALISFGGIAGVSMASQPETIFNYVAPFTCPNGTLNYEEYTASYNRPGETNFYIECIAADGTKKDVTGAAIGYSMLGFYLACFLPLCVPGGIAALVIPLFFARKRKEESVIEAI